MAVWRSKTNFATKKEFRARLVAKGFMQHQGVNFTETYSPLVRHSTLRIFFALAAQLNLNTAHLDVNTAFLDSDLDETIYMEKPDYFANSSNDTKVLKLQKAIYITTVNTGKMHINLTSKVPVIYHHIPRKTLSSWNLPGFVE